MPIQKCSAQVDGSRLLVMPTRASPTSLPFPILKSGLLPPTSFPRCRLSGRRSGATPGSAVARDQRRSDSAYGPFGSAHPSLKMTAHTAPLAAASNDPCRTVSGGNELVGLSTRHAHTATGGPSGSSTGPSSVLKQVG
jgi:hypothetical protein